MDIGQVSEIFLATPQTFGIYEFVGKYLHLLYTRASSMSFPLFVHFSFTSYFSEFSTCI